MTFGRREAIQAKALSVGASALLIVGVGVLVYRLGLQDEQFDHKALLATAGALCGAATLIWYRQPRRWMLAIVAILGTLLRFLPMSRFPDEVLGLSGLFGTFIDTVAHCFPCHPATIPFYSPEPLPFAYPPLAFQMLAMVKVILGVETTSLMKVASPLFSALTIPLFYLGATQITQRWREQISATAIYAFTPTAYYAHVAGAGFPRSLAYGWLLLGFYASLRLADEKQIRWVVLLGVIFGLTILTHPLVTVVFVLMGIGMYLGRDLSMRGLGRFALSSLIGVGIASPYLISVVASHGIEPFVSALQSSGGGSGDRLFEVLTLQIDASPFITLWTVFAIIGGLYSAAQREWMMLILFGLLGLTPQTPDLFLIIPVAYLASTALHRVVIPGLAVESRFRTGAALALIAAGFGQGFFNSWTHLVPILDQAEAQAMIDARDVIPENAVVLGIGTETEWLGFYLQRQVANSYWGSEWINAPTAHWYETVMACSSADCVRKIADESGASYLFMPLRANGISTFQVKLLLNDLDSSSKFRRIFSSESAAIYATVP